LKIIVTLSDISHYGRPI